MDFFLRRKSILGFLIFQILGPWAQGPMGPGPRAHGPTGPWAQGPYGTRGTPTILEILPPPSQPAPRGRDKPVVETPHWDHTFLPAVLRITDYSFTNYGIYLTGSRTGPRAHEPWAQGPMGPWARGPMGPGPWAQVPRARGPRARGPRASGPRARGPLGPGPLGPGPMNPGPISQGPIGPGGQDP